MSTIFISYASKNKTPVTALAQDLETAGHEIWFDQMLTGGQGWWDQILSNIRQCDLFVFALTPEALDSYPCQLEYTYAHQLQKAVLPVLVADGVSVDFLPPQLSAIQFVDYRTQDRQAAFRLIAALSKLPPSPPLPHPLPDPPPVPVSYLGSLKEQLDAPKAMSFEEQAALVLRLKQSLEDNKNRADAVSLLRRMKERTDLFAKIDHEIDSLLEREDPHSAGVARSMPMWARAADRGTKSEPERAPSEQTAEGIPPTFRHVGIPLILISISFGLLNVLSLTLSATLSCFPCSVQALIITRESVIGILTTLFAHGIASAFILRRLQPSAQRGIRLGWLLRSGLMGAWMNGFLLRRVAPATRWYHILFVAVGWGAAFFFPSLFQYYYTEAALFTFGLAGFIGGIVTYATLKWVWRDRTG